MTKLISSSPNQVPSSSDLGTIAFQDSNNVQITGGAVTLGNSSTSGYFRDTATGLEIKPSLILDFVNSKTIDPRITFSRASYAAYYDGSTTVAAEQNLITSSQDFTGWAKQNVTVAPNSTIAPDGTNTASTLIPNSGSVDFPCVYRSVAQANVTISIYAKPAGKSWINFISSGGNSGAVWFNLSTGTIGTNANSGVYNAKITSAGNGWYRCSVFYNNITANLIQINVSDDDNTTLVSGNGASGVYIWGAQVENRPGPTAYLATTSSPITNSIPKLMFALNNVGRIDHDPITQECKGFLIEESRTNVCTYSADFANWATSGTTIQPAATIAPDGTLAAAKIVCDTGSTYHYIRGSISSLSGGWTFSIYAKAAGYDRLTMWVSITNYAGFNLTTGTVESTLGTGLTGASIQAVGNGWYRCSMTSTTATSGTNVYLNPFNGPFTNGNTNPYFVGDNYSGLYVWGAQMESARNPTSYIPTTASTASRANEYAKMEGYNLSSWYKQGPGTLYTDVTVYGVPVAGAINRTMASFHNGTMHMWHLWWETTWTASTLNYYASYDAQMTDSKTLASGDRVKQATAFQNNDYTVAFNTGTVKTDTSVFAQYNTKYLYIGNNNGGSQLGGWIREIVYYPAKLSTAELQELVL